MWADLAGLTARCAAAHQRQAYAAARQVRSWLFHARPRRCWKALPGRMSRERAALGAAGAAEKGVGGTAGRRAATGRAAAAGAAASMGATCSTPMSAVLR